VSELLLDDWDRYAFHHQLVCMGVTQAMRIHLYYGKNTAHHKNRRFMETLATARWADLRR
jgi:hypothetical protein